MGLDVTLYHLPNIDAKRVALYSRKSSQICLDTQGGDRPPLTEQEIEALRTRCRHLALRLGLPGNIEERLTDMTRVELPSVKHPDKHQIGYWRSGYGGGGIDTVFKTSVGKGLYDAFPEARQGGEYICPNWKRSLRVLRTLLARFEKKGASNDQFHQANARNIDIFQNFAQWASPTTPEGRAFLGRLGEALKDEPMFRDYCDEMEAIIETVEYVLTQPDSECYLLAWSA